MNTKIIGFVFASLIAGSAFAQSTIAVVDIQKAIQTSEQGKKAKALMEGEFNKRKKELDKKQDDIKKMQADLEKRISVLSEEVAEKKKFELQEEMMRFQKVVAENQLEIQNKEKSVLEPIITKLRRVIEKIATDKKISVVFERGNQSLVYADKSLDITDEVIKAFEKEK